MIAIAETSEHTRRAQVLKIVREAGTPLSAAEIAGRAGVHVNTARFHLDALANQDAVVQTLARPSGPGRPRAVYAPRPGMDRAGARSYRLLAQILLSYMSSAGPDAGEAAAQAGRAWGGFLAGPPEPFRPVTGAEAVSRLTAFLTDLGFAPELEPGAGGWLPAVIRLRHCPFLELAEKYGQLVCQVHLGLMQGALAGLRAPVTATSLEPFAAPDGCLAHLEPAGTA